jgi:hypothetical protein
VLGNHRSSPVLSNSKDHELLRTWVRRDTTDLSTSEDSQPTRHDVNAFNFSFGSGASIVTKVQSWSAGRAIPSGIQVRCHISAACNQEFHRANGLNSGVAAATWLAKLFGMAMGPVADLSCPSSHP